MAATDDLLQVVPEAERRLPPLRPEEERRLLRLLRRGQWAARRLQEGRRLSPRRTRALEAMVAQGCEARETMVRRNLRLVAREARWAARLARTLDADDLYQEGLIGLLRAIDKFDWRRGLRFSTYATYWIRQAIGRALDEADGLVRLPAHVSDGVHRAERLAELWQALGDQRPIAEAARAAGLSPGLYTAAAAVREMLSLDRPPGAGDDHPLGDSLAAPLPDPDAGLRAAETRRLLGRALAQLPPRTRMMVALRWGLVDGEPWTLEAIARRFQLSRERVRQILEEALVTLRRLVPRSAADDLI